MDNKSAAGGDSEFIDSASEILAEGHFNLVNILHQSLSSNANAVRLSISTSPCASLGKNCC